MVFSAMLRNVEPDKAAQAVAVDTGEQVLDVGDHVLGRGPDRHLAYQDRLAGQPSHQLDGLQEDDLEVVLGEHVVAVEADLVDVPPAWPPGPGRWRREVDGRRLPHPGDQRTSRGGGQQLVDVPPGAD